MENRVAAYLSALFAGIGLSPVERIPVLGRTGPDLTINELGLVVDVKSRQACPKMYFCGSVCFDGEYLAVPLSLLPQWTASSCQPGAPAAFLDDRAPLVGAHARLDAGKPSGWNHRHDPAPAKNACRPGCFNHFEQ